jgi:hypothetical protein
LGGAGGICVHAAVSAPAITISAMWVVFLEIGIALGLAVFIVWFTWPKKPDRKDSMQDPRD